MGVSPQRNKILCFVISDETRMQSSRALSSKKNISFIKMEIFNRNFTGGGGWGGDIKNNLQLLFDFFLIANSYMNIP